MQAERKTPSLKTVEKALDLLDLVAASEGPMAASEISGQLGMTLSSTYKFLTTLTSRGFLDYQSEGKSYRLGAKYLHYAQVVHRDLNFSRAAHPYMVELSSVTRETVHLGMPDGIYGVFVDKIDSSQTIGVQTKIGTRKLLNSGATFKAMMAFIPNETFEELCSYLLENYEEGKRLVEEARDQRKLIRRDMIAVTFSEFQTGVAAIAAPILGIQGHLIGSMAIAGPIERFTPEQVERYIPLVKAACQKLSRSFGY